MGTRLFVRVDYVCHVIGATVPTPEEMLADVPAGTAGRLDLFEKSRPNFDSISNSYPDLDKWYEALMADDDLDTLHNFRMFGYGKLNGAEADYISSLGQDNICGSLSSPEQVEHLLQLHGVKVPDCIRVTEVSWS